MGKSKTSSLEEFIERARTARTPCYICALPVADEINRGIAAGAPLKTVARWIIETGHITDRTLTGVRQRLEKHKDECFD